ncbi:MAG: prepilin-type N-terminal cleavage/methylation domain-containing protein [Clostridia bacterium]|nr:prepilin-type N-terminal cleavage/methylation domain-containing protein [Clostridia bacterium]
MIKNEKGFTLMELMIVIVIIGVLAAVGVPAYKGMTDKAREAACDANLRTVQTAVSMYYAEYGEYPANLLPATLADRDGNPYIENIDSLTTCPADKTTVYTLAGGVVSCASAKHPHNN